jgi:hypothetical protein
VGSRPTATRRAASKAGSQSSNGFVELMLKPGWATKYFT